jgi:hypothetical protein
MRQIELAALVCLAGCTGAIGGPPEQGTSEMPDPAGGGSTGAPSAMDLPTAGGGPPLPSGTPVPPPGTPGAGETSRAFTPAPAGLRRLTHGEYERSVRDLTGVTFNASILEPDQRDGVAFASMGAYRVTTSPRGVEKLGAAAASIARQAFTGPGRDKLVGCTPSGAADACVQGFLKTFGRRVFRRPLDAEELAAFGRVVTVTAAEQGNVWTGLELAVAALLQSPSFVYVPEVGEADPTDARRLRFTSWEMASRLAFALTGSAPDGMLLDAAERAELLSPDGVRRHADRLLGTPGARATLARFLRENWQYEGVDELTKNRTSYPTFDAVLAAAMGAETDQVAADLALRPVGDFLEVLDTRSTYVTPALAKHYGLPAPTGTAPTRAELPAAGPRSGLLTRAAWLSVNAHATTSSPTLRGIAIRERVLCQTVPAPPPGAMAEFKDPPVKGKTARVRLEQHRSDPTCAGCHALIDPMGLAFENFDGVGAHRSNDGGTPLDLNGMLDGVAFDGSAALMRLLKADPRVAACLVRELYRFATGHEDTPGEAPVLDELVRRFESQGRSFRALAVDLVASAGFRYAVRAP